MINSVIFDLDDTLYSYKPLHEQAMGQLKIFVTDRFGISETDFWNAFKSAQQKNKENLRNTAAEHNRMLYFQYMLEHLKQNPVESSLVMYDLYWNTILNNMKLEKDAEILLKNCRKMGFKIGICTDLTSNIQHRKIHQLGLTPYIDAIVTSEECGIEKPSPKMFQTILHKLEAEPKNAVFIGDNYEKDIIGAEKVGITAIWYTEDVQNLYARKANNMQDIWKILYELYQYQKA